MVVNSVAELGPMNIVTGFPDLSFACTRNESGTILILVKPDCCKLLVNCCRRPGPPGCDLVVVIAGAVLEPELTPCASAPDETVVSMATATKIVFFIACSPLFTRPRQQQSGCQLVPNIEA